MRVRQRERLGVGELETEGVRDRVSERARKRENESNDTDCQSHNTACSTMLPEMLQSRQGTAIAVQCLHGGPIEQFCDALEVTTFSAQRQRSFTA